MKGALDIKHYSYRAVGMHLYENVVNLYNSTILMLEIY